MRAEVPSRRVAARVGDDTRRRVVRIAGLRLAALGRDLRSRLAVRVSGLGMRGSGDQIDVVAPLCQAVLRVGAPLQAAHVRRLFADLDPVLAVDVCRDARRAVRRLGVAGIVLLRSRQGVRDANVLGHVTYSRALAVKLGLTSLVTR